MKLSASVLFVILALTMPFLAQPQNYAVDAFKKLQTLAGDWQGKDDQRNT